MTLAFLATPDGLPSGVASFPADAARLPAFLAASSGRGLA